MAQDSGAYPRVSPDGGRILARVCDLNDALTCQLCFGYFRDAHTMKECLHTFCKWCLIDAFKKPSRSCPACGCGWYGRKWDTVCVKDATKQKLVDMLLAATKPERLVPAHMPTHMPTHVPTHEPERASAAAPVAAAAAALANGGGSRGPAHGSAGSRAGDAAAASTSAPGAGAATADALPQGHVHKIYPVPLEDSPLKLTVLTKILAPRHQDKAKMYSVFQILRGRFEANYPGDAGAATHELRFWAGRSGGEKRIAELDDEMAVSDVFAKFGMVHPSKPETRLYLYYEALPIGHPRKRAR